LVQTEFNNLAYDEDKNVFIEGALSAAGAAAGHRAGGLATIASGGANAGNLKPYIFGSAAGPATAELVQSMADALDMNPADEAKADGQ